MSGWPALRARIGIRHVGDHHLPLGNCAPEKIVKAGEFKVADFFVTVQSLLVEVAISDLVPHNAFMGQHAQGGADDHADESIFALRLIDGAPQEPAHRLLPIASLDISAKSFGNRSKRSARASQLTRLPADLQLRHHLPAQHPQSLLLRWRQRSRHMVNNAQRAKRMPSRRD